MKVSNKILWVAIGGLFGCVVALLIFIRLSTAPLMEKIEPQSNMTGKISGSGMVIYDGEVRHQEVKISGSGSIQRRKSTV